jgi:hypothetical protein
MSVLTRELSMGWYVRSYRVNTAAQDLSTDPTRYKAFAEASQQLASVLADQRSKGRETEAGDNHRIRISRGGILYAEMWIEDESGPVELPNDPSYFIDSLEPGDTP